MRARHDNPALHRIEVERDSEGQPENVRFVCDGDSEAPCHHFPACECEVFDRALHGQTAGQVIGFEKGHPLYAAETIPPQPGHEDVQQDVCWIDPWFNMGNAVSDWVDLYEGPEHRVPHPDGGTYDDWSWLVSGPVSVTFEGEYMTWEYAS